MSAETLRRFWMTGVGRVGKHRDFYLRRRELFCPIRDLWTGFGCFIDDACSWEPHEL